MHYDFKMAEHEEHGFTGLQALFMEGAEPVAGLTAAHDIMEHFPCSLDSDGEALALGAALYIRGKGGFWRGNMMGYSPGQIIGSDVVRLYSESWKWGSITDPGETRALDEETEEWLDSAISWGLKELRDEMEQSPPRFWAGWVRGWLRKGFRKARKRYDRDSYTLSDTFEKMTKDLDQAIKYADTYDIVRVDFVRKTCQFDVRVISLYEPDHPDYVDFEDDEW